MNKAETAGDDVNKAAVSKKDSGVNLFGGIYAVARVTVLPNVRWRSFTGSDRLRVVEPV